MTRPTRDALVTAALLILPVAILLAHARYYLPFLWDDALISLRYADRLLDGKGLTWTEGRAVEGYSNLLWILAVALLGRFGVDLIDAARILGVACMVGAMASLALWYVRTGNHRTAWLPVCTSLLFLSLAAPFAVWAIGGLEQPLYAVLLATAIPLAFSILSRLQGTGRGTVWGLSLVLGLLCLTRPDGPLFAVLTAATLGLAGWLDRRRIPVSTVLATLALPVAFSAGQLLFRLGYYGDLLPNTALVKVRPSVAHWLAGLDYLGNCLHSLAPFSWLAIACLLATVADAGTRARGAFLLALAVAWSGYVAFIGGDVSAAYRHAIPLIIVFAFALAEGGGLLVRRVSARPAVLGLVAAGLVALAVPYVRWQHADENNNRAVHERWEWKGRDLALLLKSSFAEQQPLLAVTAAGCLPYWSELPALDMLGLNDHYLPRHPPPDIGERLVGHELGSGRYVLDRNPDIIVFNVGTPPWYRSGDDLNRMPEFHERFVPAKVRASPVAAPGFVYFNKYSGKIGIRQSESTIVVPAFLLTGNKSVARLNEAGRLAVAVRPDDPVRLTFEAATDQAWSVGQATGVRADLRQQGRTCTVTVHATGSAPVEIQELVLTRRSGGGHTAGATASRLPLSE